MGDNKDNLLNKEENPSINKDNNKKTKTKEPLKATVIILIIILVVLLIVLIPIIQLIKMINIDNDRDDHHMEEDRYRRMAFEFNSVLVSIAEKEYKDLTTFNESYSPVEKIVAIDLDSDSLSYVVSTHQDDTLIIDIKGEFTNYTNCMESLIANYNKSIYDIESSLATKVDDDTLMNKFRDHIIGSGENSKEVTKLVYEAYTFNNPDKIYISASYQSVDDYYSCREVEYTVSTDTFSFGTSPKTADREERPLYYFYKENLLANAN